MIEHTLQYLALVACLVIFFKVEPVLNLMGPRCRLPVRLAFWMLASGPLAIIVSMAQGYRPNLGTVLALAGVALLLLVERRIHGLLRLPGHFMRERRDR